MNVDAFWIVVLSFVAISGWIFWVWAQIAWRDALRGWKKTVAEWRETVEAWKKCANTKGCPKKNKEP